MNRTKVGRPVDISGINVVEIQNWLNSNKMARKILICQSIIALNRQIPMNEVCRVLGVTRESVRLWKEQLRKEGLNGLLKEKKPGKRSKLDEKKRKELKNITRISPKKQGYNKSKWTGLLIQDFVLKKWGFNISLRTAQLWLAIIR
jgi:transposase